MRMMRMMRVMRVMRNIELYIMANVHGLGGGNNGNNGGGRPNPGGYQNLDPGAAEDIPFMNPMKGDQRPVMDETIPYTLKIICCPDLRVFSSATLYLAAIWIIYIICLSRGMDTANKEVL